jgi:hypothetical protein
MHNQVTSYLLELKDSQHKIVLEYHSKQEFPIRRFLVQCPAISERTTWKEKAVGGKGVMEIHAQLNMMWLRIPQTGCLKNVPLHTSQIKTMDIYIYILSPPPLKSHKWTDSILV